MEGEIEIQKVYEDENILAIVKPAGVLVHAVPPASMINSPRELTVSDWVRKKYPSARHTGDARRPGIVHRLDKNTSGVMVVAKTPRGFEYLKNLFKAGEIRKTYLALVEGAVAQRSGRIEKPIAIKSGTIKRTTFAGKDAKRAVTEYSVVNILECGGKKFSLVRAIPKTGRTHQIRVHFASLHHPVAGDTLYGAKDGTLGLRRQFLHAESLEFNLENGKRIKIESELQGDLAEALKKCKTQTSNLKMQNEK